LSLPIFWGDDVKEDEIGSEYWTQGKERKVHKEGRNEGRKDGRGRKEGRKEGRKKGRKEGRKKGRKEGRKKERKEGDHLENLGLNTSVILKQTLEEVVCGGSWMCELD